MPATKTTQSPTTSKTAPSAPRQGQTLTRRYEEKSVPTQDSRPIGEIKVTFHSDGGVDVEVLMSDEQSISNRLLNKSWSKVLKAVLHAKKNKAKDVIQKNNKEDSNAAA